jgi:hypothetical protein
MNWGDVVRVALAILVLSVLAGMVTDWGGLCRAKADDQALPAFLFKEPLRIECHGGWRILYELRATDGSPIIVAPISTSKLYEGSSAYIHLEPLQAVWYGFAPPTWVAHVYLEVEDFNPWTRADWDFDGDVDLHDFSMFQNAWATFQRTE